MMSQDSSPRSLSDELQTLKAGNQRLARQTRNARTLAVFGLLLNLVVVSVAARPGQVPKTIEAQEFVLRSAEGKMLATLRQAPENGGGQLVVMKDDKIRIGLGVDSKDEAILDIRGNDESGIIQMGTMGGAGVIMLKDQNYKPGGLARLALYTSKKGSAGISMASPAGHEVMRMEHDAKGKTGVTFVQNIERTVPGSLVGFGIDSDNMPAFSMKGSNGKAAAWIGFDGLGLPYLQMLDLQGKSQLRIPAESLVQEPAE